MTHDIFTTTHPTAGTRDHRAGPHRLETEEESQSWRHYGTWTGSRQSAIGQAIGLVYPVHHADGAANARVFTNPRSGVGRLVYTVKTEQYNHLNRHHAISEPPDPPAEEK